MNKILLVEDQREFQVIVSQILTDSQHEVLTAKTIAEAKEKLAQESFDLILLDIALPDQSGLDFYAELQNIAEAKNCPVIFLTGNESPVQKVAAFTLGADDYITKPFHYQEFKARVVSRIKKSQASRQTQDSVGPFQFKVGSQRAYLAFNGTELDLTPKEFRLLYFLAKHDDLVLTRDRLLDEVWGRQVNVTDRTVDTHIYLLRKKLGDWSDCIESVPGQGYRFCSRPKKKKMAA